MGAGGDIAAVLLPATIEVVVAERQPLGLVRLATQLYLIDSTGTLIDEYRPQFADFSGCR